VRWRASPHFPLTPLATSQPPSPRSPASRPSASSPKPSPPRRPLPCFRRALHPFAPSFLSDPTVAPFLPSHAAPSPGQQLLVLRPRARQRLPHAHVRSRPRPVVVGRRGPTLATAALRRVDLPPAQGWARQAPSGLGRAQGAGWTSAFGQGDTGTRCGPPYREVRRAPRVRPRPTWFPSTRHLTNLLPGSPACSTTSTTPRRTRPASSRSALPKTSSWPRSFLPSSAEPSRSRSRWPTCRTATTCGAAEG